MAVHPSTHASNRIKAVRESRGLSLEALAASLNSSNQQLSYLETGKRRLTVDWLMRLGHALNCHPWELVSDGLPEPMVPDELRLLRNFRELATSQQAAILGVVDAMGEKKTRRRTGSSR